MQVQLQYSTINNNTNLLQITGSESESNRLLILQALFNNIEIQNLSNSDDTQVLQKALKENIDIIDVHHAGTAMRFLTAYYACKDGTEITLTGSNRMQERPIGVLVDALRNLGADITYLGQDGYPPLKIKGKTLVENEVNIQANVSSQYISALLLIAPYLKNGLCLTLDGEVTSSPYIKMTLSLLEKIGVQTQFIGNEITVKPYKSKFKREILVVESDWSSASYFYSLVALSPIGTKLKLSSYFKNSLQGDSILATIYQQFGVNTTFKENSITLEKVTYHKISTLIEDLKNAPDIAQTIVVTAFGLGIACELSGLHTLKIKETDRLIALQEELQKLGASIQVSHNSLSLFPTKKINTAISITTYQDHRMAMAFSPLVLKTSLFIEDASVVSKSFPSFWDNLVEIGLNVNFDNK